MDDDMPNCRKEIKYLRRISVAFISLCAFCVVMALVTN